MFLSNLFRVQAFERPSPTLHSHSVHTHPNTTSRVFYTRSSCWCAGPVVFTTSFACPVPVPRAIMLVGFMGLYCWELVSL
jgi:hypothetical protein